VKKIIFFLLKKMNKYFSNENVEFKTRSIEFLFKIHGIKTPSDLKTEEARTILEKYCDIVTRLTSLNTEIFLYFSLNLNNEPEHLLAEMSKLSSELQMYSDFLSSAIFVQTEETKSKFLPLFLSKE
jgi:hypothetical protein